MALLDVEDLRVDIPLADRVLHPVRGVSFALARGETLGIVGESAAASR
jgi:ABC-type dipeptide/oligopeptide/nickel transport system ATPase component